MKKNSPKKKPIRKKPISKKFVIKKKEKKFLRKHQKKTKKEN